LRQPNQDRDCELEPGYLGIDGGHRNYGGNKREPQQSLAESQSLTRSADVRIICWRSCRIQHPDALILPPSSAQASSSCQKAHQHLSWTSYAQQHKTTPTPTHANTETSASLPPPPTSFFFHAPSPSTQFHRQSSLEQRKKQGTEKQRSRRATVGAIHPANLAA
jgi:hypothetical protein